MITNMVSERYPKNEDEKFVGDEVPTVYAPILKNLASRNCFRQFRFSKQPGFKPFN